MNQLFIVTKSDFFEDNPEAMAIPLFVSLGSDSMKYITLVYAYRSPFRNLPLDQRKKKALEYSGINLTPTGRPSKIQKDLVEIRTEEVKKAIELFNELQYDEDLETLKAYDDQLKEFREFMKKKNKDEKELQKAALISTKYYKETLIARDEIKERLSLRDNDIEEEGSSKIEDVSALEAFMNSNSQ